MSGVFYVIGGACILVAVLILIAVVSYNHVVAKPVKRDRKDIQLEKEYPSGTTVLPYETIGRQSPVKKKNKDSKLVIGSSLSAKTERNVSSSYRMDVNHMITIPYEDERQSHRSSSFYDTNDNDSSRYSDNSYSSNSDSGSSDSGGGGGSD